MTANGAEIRFWLYLDTTTSSRLIEDYAAGVAAADRAFQLQFAADGAINVFTDRAGNPNGYTTAAYTPVGTYTTGWTAVPHRLRLRRRQTYTLSKRASSDRRLDAAQGRRRHRLRHPVPRRQHHHRHPRHALARPGQRAACGSTTLAFADSGITRRRHHAARRAHRPCRHARQPRRSSLVLERQHRARPRRLQRLPRRRQASTARPDHRATTYTDAGR